MARPIYGKVNAVFFLLDCLPALKDAPTPRKEKLWNAEISSSRLSPRL